MASPRKKLPSFQTRVRAAKKVALHAINEAAIAASRAEGSRSTRTRSAYKIKAEALDRVTLILAGKE